MKPSLFIRFLAHAITGPLMMLGYSSFGASQEWKQENGYRFQKLATPPMESDVSTPSGFSALPAETTNILFVNHLSEEDIVKNQNFMNGSGVSAGDFNGDGLYDLYFCSIRGSNALYQNLGDWIFKDITRQSGLELAGLASTGSTFAHLNEDNHLDLLVTTLGNGVHSFINQGNGKFIETTVNAGLASKAGSTSMALGDVDLDGDLDLYVANYGEIPIVNSGGGAKLKRINGRWVVTGPFAKRLRINNGKLEELGEPDQLYLNDGSGNFQTVPWGSKSFLDEDGNPVDEPWEFGLSVQMRDVDQDGDIDIYVCNDFQSPDHLWLNQGNGKFKAIDRLKLRKQSYASMGVDFADIDRDGKLDFYVVEMLSRNHRDRMTQVVGLRPEIPYPARITHRPEVARNTLFKQLDDGAYAEIANYSNLGATDWSWQPVFLDVDLDGYEDLLVVNGMSHDTQDRDTLEMIRSNRKQTPEQARRNVLKYPDRKAHNMAFKNMGQWQFRDYSKTWSFHHLGITHGILLADLDNDGDQDVVTNNLNEPPGLYRNETKAKRLRVSLQSHSLNRHGVGARIEVSSPGNPKQIQHIMAGGRYLSSDAPSRTFAALSASDNHQITVYWPGGHQSVIEKAKSNHHYLIQETGATESPDAGYHNLPNQKTVFKDVSHHIQHTHHEQLFNDFIRQPLLPRLQSQNGPAVAWVDLNGDHVDELVVGSGRGGNLAAWRIDDEFQFSPIAPAAPWIAPDDTTGMTAWVWGDGSRSLLFAVSQYESGPQNKGPVKELTLTDQGFYRVSDIEEITATESSPGPLASADVDGDGDLDLFVGGRIIPGKFPQPASSRLYRQRNGRLEEDLESTKLLKNVGMVLGAIWCDFHQDGYPDLVLSCEWGPIRIFDNVNGRLSEWNPTVSFPKESKYSKKLLSEMTGWWRGVTSGDLNNDGKLDLVIANWGLNDDYRASFDHPLKLYYGNLNGTGRTDLLETQFSTSLNAQVPVRNFNELRQNFPTFLSFKTHQHFSQTTVNNLLKALPNSTAKSSAAVLESMILLNHGGSLEAIALPAEAQWSPAFSVNVTDVDNDGYEDIFLSQNYFAVRPGWARLDAGRGLLLKGDGSGQPTTIPSASSGIAMYGEQRGAALADVNQDGKMDLLATQNAAQTKFYINQTARPGLIIQLEGTKANPDGIGAVLQLETETGMSQARQIQSGSGIGSQSSTIQIMATASTPKHLHILWPGGIKSKHPIPANSHRLRVKHPTGN